MKNKINPILNTDSYKLSHFSMYPKNTTEVYSYMESRGGKYDQTVFFGAQGLVNQYLMDPITAEDIAEAKDVAAQHGMPFNEYGWKIILNEYGGFFPVEIRAVPEGTVIPTKNVLMDVRNTDGRVPFITSYIETMALRLWYPITVATRSYEMKKRLVEYFRKTSDSMNMDFAILDFGARGCSSEESNAIGGAAHLLNFRGSDSLSAIQYVRHNYGGEVVGYSVPATEHSIMCAYGLENEFASFERLVDLAAPGSILSVVSDTWNIYEATKKWVALADKIIKKNITLVVRPDSGDIANVMKKVLVVLRDGFGYTVNNKGYEVLKNVKVLWGDGMNENTIHTPYAVAEQLGISADSILAGSGGGLLQAGLDRDTNKFAFKASNMMINGVDTPISKDPITDPGKRSKSGKLALVNDGLIGFSTISQAQAKTYGKTDLLRPIYRNGEQFNLEDFETIRSRVQ